MKIYVITCGEYEDEHNEYVTTDIEDAAKFILKKLKESPKYRKFSTMECWENGKLLYVYWGSFYPCSIVKSLTIENIIEDIASYAK